MLAHGNREMPVWGPIFHEVEADQDWGEVRLDAITKHLESIQQKYSSMDRRGCPHIGSLRVG